jgi:hypothetical protein
MPRKVFSQEATSNDDPLVWVLSDKPLDPDQPPKWSEEFTSVPSIPAAVASDFVTAVITDEEGNSIWPIDAILGYLRVGLVDEDKERFEQVIRDPAKSIASQTLGEVVRWLAPFQTGHPTTPSPT